MIDYHFWCLNVKGYHISSIFLHMVNACLVFALLFLITRAWFVSILSGLFFLVHPTNTEAVNYISSRGDLLLVLFILLALISYIGFLNKRHILLYLASLLCFSLSLLCKETAAIFPGLILLYQIFAIRKFKIVSLLGFVAILGIYFIVRANIPNILSISEVAYNVSIPERLVNFVRIIGSYFFILAWPLSLNISRSLPPLESILDPFLIFGILLLSGSLFLLVKWWKDQN